MDTKRGSFTGSLGFILAAAGSAVGLGNLWRFPILAAKDGGGIFLLVYIIIALTFGFALMTTEITIGRKTGRSPVDAFNTINKRFTWIGWLASIVPMIILPYYCVIGGWVLKYVQIYFSDLITKTYSTAVDPTGGFFSSFITHSWYSVLLFVIFLAFTSVFVFMGVDKGIEKISRILMPILVLLIVIIAVFSLTLKDRESGRTALDGLKIYIIPNFNSMTFEKFIRVLIDAMGQIFFSMSLAMGIMITYGSYMKKDTDLLKSVSQIEIFDTVIAFFAGLIMIPSVYCFMGNSGLEKAGPSLMFISLPQVFAKMGPVFGNIIAVMFFILVLFAALTSSISIMETVVSVVMDKFKLKRSLSCIIVIAIALAVGLLVCMGYNKLYFEVTLPNKTQGQLLDILDWFSNNFLMPIVAISTCIVIGWAVGPKYVVDEIKIGAKSFKREKMYVFMLKFAAPVCLLIILLQSFGVFNFLS